MFFKNVNDELRQNQPVKWYILSIVRAIVIAMLAVFVFVGGFLLFATIAEYRPADIEEVTVEGEAQDFPAEKTELTVMTWNIGYASLGDDADFYLDGGKTSRAASKERVEENLNAIVGEIRAEDADVVFLQEIDRESSRSYKVNEWERLQIEFQNESQAFATDFKVFFIPYPVPTTLGKVDSGLGTLSKYRIENAERVALTNPYNWPFRTMNMKRCLLVSRVDLPDTDRQLVLINLHMEPYQDAVSGAAQMEELFAVMEEERAKGNYVIAGGDFNQTFNVIEGDPYPANPIYWIPSVFDTRSHTDWQFLVDASSPTARCLNVPYADATEEQIQYYMLDGYIVSSDLTVNSVETRDLGFANSDHNPVILKVEF